MRPAASALGIRSHTPVSWGRNRNPASRGLGRSGEHLLLLFCNGHRPGGTEDNLGRGGAIHLEPSVRAKALKQSDACLLADIDLSADRHGPWEVLAISRMGLSASHPMFHVKPQCAPKGSVHPVYPADPMAKNGAYAPTHRGCFHAHAR